MAWSAPSRMAVGRGGGGVREAAWPCVWPVGPERLREHSRAAASAEGGSDGWS